MRLKGVGQQLGFSVVESFIVLSMIGLLGMVSIPLLNKSRQQYEMNSCSREIMANIQLAKLKSVSNNFGYTFRFSTSGSNTYEVLGNEPVGPDGVFHAWNDANGNGQQDVDQVYPTARALTYSTFSIAGISALPTGAFVGTPPSTIEMTFQPDGRLDTGESATNYRCVVLQDRAGTTQAVCVENSGMVRLFKYSNNLWIELK